MKIDLYLFPIELPLVFVNWVADILLKKPLKLIEIGLEEGLSVF